MFRFLFQSIYELFAVVTRRRFLALLLAPAILAVVGTIGFALLEGLSLWDSLYFSIITLTTVGYGDIVPKTVAGKLFTMVLVSFGVFTFFYAAFEVIRIVVSGEIGLIAGKRQMERTLAHLKNHLIVCGFGRMGRLVCAEFSHHKIPFVVVELDSPQLEDFSMPFGVPLHGDATSDEVLRHAGIERARGLITVMGADSINLFTTMSARLLNAEVFIVARYGDPQSEQKLLRAGANRVVSPYNIAGLRMAQAIIRPTVVDFIELATRTEHIELQLEETKIAANSPLAGANLLDSRLRDDLKLIIVAIKKADGKMMFNPMPESEIIVGDIMVAIGHREQLRELELLANPALEK